MDSNYAHTSEHSTPHPQAQLVQTPASTRTLKFKDSNEANNWLHSVTMAPPVNPTTDPTIDIIASERTTWVLHMIEAIYDLTSCFDNPKMLSHFQATSSSFIPELEVEAACHILFDILISYCRYGYRGLAKTNVHVTKSSSGKKNYAVDKTVDCLTRMTNVVAALRSWKSVCKGVVEEDTKKWQLVNAPVGAVSKKESERRCNVTKKKAVVEGRKAKNELVVIKQGEQVASIQNFGLGLGNQHSSPGEDVPRPSGIASNRPHTSSHYDIVGADDPGMFTANYPEQADTTYLREPAPQSVSGSSAPHIAFDSAIYHEPQIYSQTYAPPKYPHTPEGLVATNQQHQAHSSSGAAHTPLDSAVAHAEPQHPVHGLQPASHQHSWAPATFAWPEPNPYGHATQHTALVKIENQDEDLWHQFDYLNGLSTNVNHYQQQFEDIDHKDHIPTTLGHNQVHLQTVNQGQFLQPTPLDLLAEAAIQASSPAEASRTSPSEVVSADASAELLSMASNQGNFADQVTWEEVAHADADVLVQPARSLSPPQGVKRGRGLDDEGGDEHAALRRKM